uniref:Uncharacterized protein n=1 Tax=Chromera velia CCMP2878 TaxID=1169474 RepID=A0A0G4F6F8_9ALVE|eukprot:Cvel_15373.t1-p1 / transcript=Cvel_15373.t1 / gene=Cvel_15373 / organism=Chromera_velia_CCMP2878 / gene_product=hypothetical protein / transcript_product=hypothetical protein / location=Cvel_scaffold1133:43185-44675(+) / protein_length=497 / sequence_SO=supercontig / SO=protein_coding / is_pseudo=false
MQKVKGTKSRRQRQSYDDAEGLLLNVGVVSALVLSFVFGLYLTVTIEENLRGDFFSFLIDSGLKSSCQSATDNIVDLSIRTIENSQPEFNWTLELRPGELYDVKAAAQSITQRNVDNPGRSSDVKFADPDVAVVGDILFTNVPNEIFTAWMNIRLRPIKDDIFYTCEEVRATSSVQMLLQGLACGVFLTFSLLTSVFLYFSLAWSECREDGSKFQTWWTTGKWLVMLSMFFLVLGVVLFFTTTASISYKRFPSVSMTDEQTLFQLVYVLVPSLFASGLIAIFAAVTTTDWFRKCCRSCGGLLRLKQERALGDASHLVRRFAETSTANLVMQLIKKNTGETEPSDTAIALFLAKWAVAKIEGDGPSELVAALSQPRQTEADAEKDAQELREKIDTVLSYTAGEDNEEAHDRWFVNSTCLECVGEGAAAHSCNTHVRVREVYSEVKNAAQKDGGDPSSGGKTEKAHVPEGNGAESDGAVHVAPPGTVPCPDSDHDMPAV